MKQKLLSALLMSAFAGVATTASAGVIQASYKNFAAEVFGADDVVLTAPTISYALATPLSGLVANPNSFKISWTLSDGEWNAAPAPANIVLVRPDNSGSVAATGVTLSTDKKTLEATFTITDNYTVGSQIILGGAGPVQVTKVGTKLGAPAANTCAVSTAQVDVTVKLTNAAGNEFDSNFALAPLKNTESIARSAPALSVVAVSSSAFPRTTPNALATDIESSKVDVLMPALGKAFTSVADITNNTTAINIGRVLVRDQATLFDLSGTDAYSVANAGWGANDQTLVGKVEAAALTFKIAGKFSRSNAVPNPLSFTDAAGAAVANATVSYNADNTVATVTIPAASVAALVVGVAPASASTRYLNIIYTPPATAVIPVTQFSITEGSLAKQSASKELPNAVCPGNLYNLTANGVQVDVRNYIPAIVEAPSGGWKNVVRIINTDESQPTVDVIGTALLRDGTIGASAVIAAGMKPREVRYLSGAEIDAKLNAAATATAKTFGADDIAEIGRAHV